MSLLTADRQLSRQSYYNDTAGKATQHPALLGSVTADVAIVGAGLSGLSAAIELADRGYRVAVLEARRVGWGASGRNGGQALIGLACSEDIIEAQLGAETARQVWNMTGEALDLIHARRKRFGIDCDWQQGYLSLATSERKGRQLTQHADRLERHYGHALRRIGPSEMGHWIASNRYHSGVYDERSGHLHPLKYCHGLARAAASLGVTIHEESPVQRIEHGSSVALHTATGVLRAPRVLLAGNVYLQGLMPALQRRIMAVGTFIVGSQAIQPSLASTLIPSRAAVCDTGVVFDYFRLTQDNHLLYGGRVSYGTSLPANLRETMRERMVRTFPQLHDLSIEHAWGGFVDVTMNRAPDFGRVEGLGAGNVYYLQGFSGHGLALTGLAGRLVAEAIDGDASRFDTFARLRHRPFPGGPWLRTPALMLGMTYHRLRELL